MEQFIWFSIFLLVTCTSICSSQQRDHENTGVRNYRRDVGYGRPVLAMANSPRCTFNGRPVEDGTFVSSPEPCLNCSCSRGILLCYLHTCNSIVAVPGCEIVKKPETCCPHLECKEPFGYNEYRTERTNEPGFRYKLRQDDGSFFGLIGTDYRTDKDLTTTPATRKPYGKGNGPNYSSFLKGISPHRRSDTDGQSFYVQEEDYGEDELSPDRNNSAGYCFFRGRKYPEGTAMLSPTKCEYCYCIRGQQMCVRPKCHLNVDGCVARYQSGYTCCPSHYNCDIPTNESVGGTEDENHDSLLSNKITSCNVEGHDFEVGVAVPSNGHCQTCYCTQIGVVCRRLECSPSVPGCTPIIPEGHCCPTQYKCDPKILNNTQGPISHSTENYDVTVISPSDVEGTSSQASRTENPGLATEDGEERSGTVTNLPETSTGSSSEKHKITVELSEESDLESISVIPEENIAVLVLTTEKENDDDKEPHDESDEITNETVTDEDITTKQAGTTFINSKRKVKPTIPTIIQGKDQVSTKFSTLEDITNLVTSTASHEETIKYNADSEGYEKDTYAYDYGEVYDDVTHDVKQTFSAFSDYSQPEYSETPSTQKDKESTDMTKLKNKVNYNIPSTAVLLTTKTNPPTISGESYDSRTTETAHSAYTIPKDPNRYTIYSTDRTHTSYVKDSTESLVTKQKLAQKHRPGIITKQTMVRTPSIKPIDSTTSSGTSVKEMRNDQTIPYDTTTEKRTIVPYTTEIHQTHRPKIRTTHSTNKNPSNRRRRPQRPQHSTVPRKTTQPIPQDLAEFLWSITQLQNTQTAASSTEQEDTTKQFPGTQSYSPETLPPIAIAAPKLIMEESTPGNDQEPTQTESTEVETKPATPSFNFQPPEIIFSNHGPSYNQKPDIPLIINNHKKTSTRLRPPIRFRPSQTTPSLEDTFVEISNHRPTNTIQRPPGKFPPYPHLMNRHDGGYHRDPHLRDSHPKLHRIEPDFRPNHPEDYEEYFYDSERDHQTTSKVFNNIQSQQNPSESITKENPNQPSFNSESDQPTATTNETQSYSVTSSDSDIINGEVTKSLQLPTTHVISTENIQLSQTHKDKNDSEDIVGRSSEETVKDATEDSVKVEVATTPESKTSYYTPSVTTSTPVDIYTTKSFSGYVTNKYKGTSSFVTGGDGKNFRAEDNNKGREQGFIDHRLNESGGRPSQNSPTYSEKETQKASVAVNFTQSPPPAEDSQEITDVCFVDGRYYTSGELIVKSNPCEMCKCFYGHPLCQVQQCPPPPGPSCILEYLPGYCCPSVTCGVETDPDQPPGIVSAPEPTSQEIRPPLIETDNQWKPLPHGPIVRTTESSFKTEPYFPENNQQDVKTNKENIELNRPQEPNKNILEEESQWQKQQITTSTATEQPSTTTLPTTPIVVTTQTPAIETTEIVTTPLPTTTLTPTTDEELTTLLVTSTTSSLELSPIFHPNSDNTSQNKSGIHDNSSGVRKILDGFITLPPSKVVLSPGDTSDISTVLPVIVTHPTTTTEVPEPEIELVTIAGMDLFGQSTDLGGNLKVSGCNVYGKYYRINDKVTVLSKPCSDCICSADGISCNATC